MSKTEQSYQWKDRFEIISSNLEKIANLRWKGMQQRNGKFTGRTVMAFAHF